MARESAIVFVYYASSARKDVHADAWLIAGLAPFHGHFHASFG
jgi:hypothetical protein